MVQTAADVVVIGAGVIGCSTAYHLARMGITDVLVLEMNQVGSGSSGKSASMLTLQFCHDELTLRMAKHSYARYMEFEDELGVPIDFRRTGYLSLATKEAEKDLLERAKLLQSQGVRTELLAPEEIKRQYPEINTEDLALGTWGPDDGPLDPHMIMWGYNKRASEMGVKLYQGVRTTGIDIEKGCVVGVRTASGSVRTKVVVNAAGPWAIEVGRWVGVDIPIMNSARGILVTGPFPDIPSDRPFVEDLKADWYFRPEGRGILMGMGAIPTEDLDFQITYEIMYEIIDVAIHRVPVLESASLLTAWTGIRSMTPDDQPIVGPVPSVEGLFLNCGWDGVGIIQAPFAGQLAAEYICSGRSSTLDTDSLEIRRFEKR
jgi:glycine/D-amino acid oxidase-like deaminating enzyme